MRYYLLACTISALVGLGACGGSHGSGDDGGLGDDGPGTFNDGTASSYLRNNDPSTFSIADSPTDIVRLPSSHS